MNYQEYISDLWKVVLTPKYIKTTKKSLNFYYFGFKVVLVSLSKHVAGAHEVNLSYVSSIMHDIFE